MFDTHSHLSIWGLHDAGIELRDMRLPKAPAGGNAAAGRELRQVSAPMGSDQPWKVLVPGVSPKEGPPFSTSDAALVLQEDAADALSCVPAASPEEGLRDAEGFAAGAADDEYLERCMGAFGQGWWPSMDPWASHGDWLQPGDVVCFHDLQQTVELNGTFATVQNWDEASGRWAVRLADGTEKFARPENLAVVHAQACNYPAGCFGGAEGLGDADVAGGGGPEGGSSRWWWWPSAKQGSKVRGSRKAATCGPPGIAPSSFNSDVSTSASETTRSNVSSFDVREGDGADGSPPWTTVMMRNIPNDYTGSMLLDLLDSQGFRAKYHLVYLPMDYHRKAGFGYAFIDFISNAEARRFRDVFEGFADWGLVSHKVCNVSWSDALQGVQAHIDRYRNSPVMHDAVPDEFKPMLFEQGVRVPFPAPTKSVRAPRLRKKDPRQPLPQPPLREPRRQTA